MSDVLFFSDLSSFHEQSGYVSQTGRGKQKKNHMSKSAGNGKLQDYIA